MLPKKIIDILSIDDVITFFDKKYIDENIYNYMTKEVITVPRNFSIVSDIQKFEKYNVGRLPVTEFLHSKKIVGIITLSNILNKLLTVTQSIAGKIENEEVKNTEISADFIKNTPKKFFKFEGRGVYFNCTGKVASITKKYFKGLGIDRGIVQRIAIICYEAETNICIHSLGGTMTIEVDDENNVIICAIDKGLGIPDIDLALTPAYTTTSEKVRALGF